MFTVCDVLCMTKVNIVWEKESFGEQWRETLPSTLKEKLTDAPLREKCLHSELFLSTFSRIRTEYGEILRISPYSVRMRENEDQNNSEYGHFLRRARHFCIPSFKVSVFFFVDVANTDIQLISANSLCCTFALTLFFSCFIKFSYSITQEKNGNITGPSKEI